LATPALRHNHRFPLASYEIAIPDKRPLSIDDLTSRDDRARAKIGIDLRSVCDDLYRKEFRFVQRHPREVIIPSSKEKRFKLLFAATFGFLPESGPLADVSDIFVKALDAKPLKTKAVDFPKLFNRNIFTRSTRRTTNCHAL